VPLDQHHRLALVGLGPVPGLDLAERREELEGCGGVVGLESSALVL
jgi:hypothetical protein